MFGNTSGVRVKDESFNLRPAARFVAVWFLHTGDLLNSSSSCLDIHRSASIALALERGGVPLPCIKSPQTMEFLVTLALILFQEDGLPMVFVSAPNLDAEKLSRFGGSSLRMDQSPLQSCWKKTISSRHVQASLWQAAPGKREQATE